MEFKRTLNLFAVRSQFEQKLITDGLSPEKAKQDATTMSVGEIDQVQKDLARHPHIKVVNKKTGITIDVPKEYFTTPDHTQAFLRSLARDNDILYNYLQAYLHQGGFLHMTELLMSYYFAPDANFVTDNRVATFTIEEDGSLSYEEKFDIKKIKTLEVEYQKPSGRSIATISLTSKMEVEADKISPSYGDIAVKAHDIAATKFFEDHRSKFVQFLSWFKELIKSLPFKSKREQLDQVESIVIPRPKL